MHPKIIKRRLNNFKAIHIYSNSLIMFCKKYDIMHYGEAGKHINLFNEKLK